MGEGYRAKHGAEKKKYNNILLYIGAAVFLATILLVAFFASGEQETEAADLKGPPSQTPAPSEPSPAPAETPDLPVETADEPAVPPFIYEKDADIFMASGGNNIRLGSRQSLYGCYNEMNCALSKDNRYLYYIEDTDINTGTGILKKVSTNAASAPVIMEDGVCAAEVSLVSGTVMYIKDPSGIAGGLYLYKDGESSFIDGNVLPVFLRFSQGGSCISYIAEEGAGVFALYVKKDGEEPWLVTRVTAEAAISDGINLSRFIEAVPFDDGEVLYSIEENYNMPLYFFVPGGETERICNDGYIIKTYPDGGFLYADIAKNNLWYKMPGEDAVSITKNYSYSKFPEGTDRFLLIEHIGDGFENSRVLMYEVGENKEKTTISLGDDRVFEVNAAFDCVAYESEGKFYASRKTDTGWREIELLEASADNAGGSESGIVAKFDGQGDNLYFFDEYKCGPLYRFSLKDDKTEKLLDNVDRVYVFGSAVYAHVTSDKFYRIAGETDMISGGVRDAREAQGGAYLIIDGSLNYIPEGSKSAELLNSFTEPAEITGSIECRAPLEEDIVAAFEVLSEEANYCLYKLKVYKSETAEPITVDDALALSQKLAGRQGISESERNILNYMAEGFAAYEEDDSRAAADSLQNAIDAYEKYLNSVGGEEER